VAVFGFGSLVLLAGIVGGDLRYGGASLPRLGRLPRFTLTALGGVLVVASGLMWLRTLPDDAPPAAAPAAAPAAGDDVVTVTRALAAFHVAEELDVAVGQRPPVRLEVGSEQAVASVDLAVDGPGPHRYDARLVARLPGGDTGVFSGSGTVDLRQASRYRVELDRSNAGVRLVGE